MIRYNKLFALLNTRGMKKTDLLEIISAPTLAKLSKGEVVKSDVIEKICKFLKCQPGDIMEYIDEEEMLRNAENLDKKVLEVMEILKQQGLTEETLRNAMQESIEKYIPGFFNGEPQFFKDLESALKQNGEPNKET